MWTLVTGGAKRLGASLSHSLAEQGLDLVIHYRRSENEAHEVVEACRMKGVKAEAIQGDFSSEESLMDFARRYLERFPETGALINNVGEYLIRSALKTTLQEWTSLFQSNLYAPFYLVQSLSPSLIRHKGRVVNIGVAGLTRHSAYTYASAYMLAKDALLGLTRALARELAPYEVCVNMVSPGELDNSIDHHPLPMKRPATSEEICRAVQFLLNPASGYITGQNIEIAGGFGL